MGIIFLCIGARSRVKITKILFLTRVYNRYRIFRYRDFRYQLITVSRVSGLSGLFDTDFELQKLLIFACFFHVITFSILHKIHKMWRKALNHLFYQFLSELWCIYKNKLQKTRHLKLLPIDLHTQKVFITILSARSTEMFIIEHILGIWVASQQHNTLAASSIG